MKTALDKQKLVEHLTHYIDISKEDSENMYGVEFAIAEEVANCFERLLNRV